jgi:IS30 family transposase
MTRGKPTITPEMERMILNAWEASWSIERIRNHLRSNFGSWISDPMIYNAVSRARKRGDKRATRRHTDMVVSSS